MGKQDTSVKRFLNPNNKLQKYKKAPNNENKALLKIDNNTSYFKELRYINNINTIKYDESRNSNSDISDEYYNYPYSE